MNTIKKIINDTLKSPNGKWSRKSVMMVIAFTDGFLSDFMMRKIPTKIINKNSQ